MKCLHSPIFFAAVCFPLFALPAFGDEPVDEPSSDWFIKIGAGVAVGPDYEGSDDYKASAFPDLEIVWKDRISLSLSELSVDLIQTGNLTFGVAAGFSADREASDNEALRGLGDIDSSVAGSLYGNYSFDMFEFEARFSQDLGSGHEGSLVELSTSAFMPISDNLIFAVGPNMTWASDDYMQSFFGISSTQAAATSYTRYTAGSGIKDAGFHFLSQYEINDHVSLNLMANYQKLLGDAADSPLVKDKGAANQFFAGLSLSYSF